MTPQYLTIDQWMIEKNLTVSDIAKQLRVSRQHINSIKNGEPAGRALGYKLWLMSDCRLNLINLLYPSHEIARIKKTMNN